MVWCSCGSPASKSTFSAKVSFFNTALTSISAMLDDEVICKNTRLDDINVYMIHDKYISKYLKELKYTRVFPDFRVRYEHSYKTYNTKKRNWSKVSRHTRMTKSTRNPQCKTNRHANLYTRRPHNIDTHRTHKMPSQPSELRRNVKEIRPDGNPSMPICPLTGLRAHLGSSRL